MRPVDRWGRLWIRGGHLHSEFGERVQLRGVSLHWSHLQPRFFNSNLVSWVAEDWKATVIRAPLSVTPNGWLGNSGVEERRVRAVIDAAIEAGLYVIVDWHTHTPETSAAERFFSSIVKAYGTAPNVMYETWNEPLPEHSWKRTILAHHHSVGRAIREAGGEGVIIAGTRSWCQAVDEPVRVPLNLTNCCYALHFYSASHKHGLRSRVREALKNGLPMFVSEWGASQANGAGPLDFGQTEKWMALLDAASVSIVNWSISNADESSAALLPGSSSLGGWTTSDLSSSGRYVRGLLRARG